MAAGEASYTDSGAIDIAHAGSIVVHNGKIVLALPSYEHDRAGFTRFPDWQAVRCPELVYFGLIRQLITTTSGLIHVDKI